ncbi:hypothetical protein CVT25_009190 [Psilocybe cyanescens]|uniref:Uncharacterized protein n=1 Tax=Psilocybe cyanescens TaxID=93625 RepID=A0A409WWC9_PSICY|nr:hypothetical protein CVT25_009190 [Psilocybe cyanescens]
MAELAEEHPLSLELQSLKASVARFQDEAHASAVKLQRHSLDAVRTHERAVHLERENDMLKAELAILRAHPHPNGQASTTESQNQVQELTLSLRRLSHKLSLTEEALLAAHIGLANAHAATTKAAANADNAYELGARVRGREEEGLIRQRDLECKIKKLEEELKMSDGVVQEYASLVRSMEAQSSSEAQTSYLQESLKEGRLGLDRLLSELQGECDALARKLDENTAELEVCKSKLEAERKGNEAVQAELGRTQTELSKLQLEDGTAAKMVSRYMQFSQTSTNNLLTTLNTLQSRHNATLATLSSQNHTLSTQLRSLESQNERLRSALDEIGGDIMKETYGRRREIAQRIRMGGREERVVEGLRRWVRRGEEMLSRLREGGEVHESHLYVEALLDMAQHARILLEGLDNGVLDTESALSLSGGRARELLVRTGLDGLLEELRKETERRLILEKAVAQIGPNVTALEKNMCESLDDAPPQVPEKAHIMPLPPLPSSSSSSSLPNGDPAGLVPTVVVDDCEISVATDAVSSTVGPSADTHLVEEEQVDSPGGDGAATSVPPSLEHPTASPTPLTPVEDVMQPQSPVEEVASNATLEAIQDMPPVQDLPTSNDAVNEVKEVEITDLSDVQEVTDAAKSQSDTVDGMATSLSFSSIPTSATSTVSSVFLPPTTISSTPDTPVKLEPPVVAQPHPMLAELNKINKRYDDLQRAFRDCHLALEGLKISLNASSSSANGYPISPAFGHFSSSSSSSLSSPLATPEPSSTTTIPTSVLRAALGRLDDYTEDARVELEIRVGDETLLAKGYEALLSIPGALLGVHEQEPEKSTNVDSISGGSHIPQDNEVPIQSEVEKQIEAFVAGTDPAVRKARDTFMRKLEDVQHDIAALKRAIHDPESLEAPNISADSSASNSSLVSPHTDNTNTNGTGTANGWTSWIRGSPSKPSSPASVAPSLGPSPTFGSIMTSPRLRSTSSTGNFHQNQGAGQNNPSRSRKGSFFGFGLGGGTEQMKDPLAVLGLKVPMPSFAGAAVAPGVGALGGGGSGNGGYGMMMSPTSPMGSAPRARTVSSTMYMLGLGAAGPASPGQSANLRMVRSPSGGGPLNMHLPHASQSSIGSVQAQMETAAVVRGEGPDTTDDEMEEEENADEDDDDTDVE